MDKLPEQNDVLLVEYGFDRRLWYVHDRCGDFVRIGPKGWLVSCFLWWGIEELRAHRAVVVGRCIRIWPFRLFRLKRHNTRLARRLDILDLARMIGHANLGELRTYYRERAEDIAARL